jgi:hypothetical protein
MLLRWSNEKNETVVVGCASIAIDEQVPTQEGLAAGTMYVVPEVEYTGAFMELFDLLYGPRAPINALFPALRLWVDGVLQDGSTLAIFGEHQLWVQGDPVFTRNVFLHLPRFYELKTNVMDLTLHAGMLIHKHRDRLPWREST